MTMRNGVYTLNGSPHNHGPETQELRRIALVNECVAKAAAHSQAILVRYFEKFTERGKSSGFFIVLIFIQLYAFNSSYMDVPASFDAALQKRMQNARKKNGPVLPKSIPDIEEICKKIDEYYIDILTKVI